MLALAFMFSLNVKLSLATLAPYAILFVAIRFLTRTLMERSLKVQEGLGTIGAKVQESLSGIHVIKAYTLEEREAEHFRALNDDYNELGLALARVRGTLMPMIRGTVAMSNHDSTHLWRFVDSSASGFDRRPGGLHGVSRRNSHGQPYRSDG